MKTRGTNLMRFGSRELYRLIKPELFMVIQALLSHSLLFLKLVSDALFILIVVFVFGWDIEGIDSLISSWSYGLFWHLIHWWYVIPAPLTNFNKVRFSNIQVSRSRSLSDIRNPCWICTCCWWALYCNWWFHCYSF